MTKRSTIVVLVVAALIAAAAAVALAQTEWKVTPAPVFTPGDKSAWDGGDIQMGDVVKVGDHYLMVYSAHAVDAPGHGANRLGMAMSPDGVNWFKYAANPVLGPDCRGPCLLFDPEDEAARYKLWYGHWQEEGGATEIRCATSTDGVHWKAAGTAIARDAASRVEKEVAHPSVVKAGGKYYLYYDIYANSDTLPPADRCVAVATSTDAVNWTKAGVALNSAGGTALDYRVGDPAVVYADGQFMMWYKCMPPANDDPVRERIGLATSSDGLTFTRDPGGPVLSPSADPEVFPQRSVFGPAVVWDRGVFRMWFGSPSGDKTGFGYAVSAGIPQAAATGNP